MKTQRTTTLITTAAISFSDYILSMCKMMDAVTTSTNTIANSNADNVA